MHCLQSWRRAVVKPTGLLVMDKLKKGMYQGEKENEVVRRRRRRAKVTKLKGSNKRKNENAENFFYFVKATTLPHLIGGVRQ